MCIRSKVIVSQEYFDYRESKKREYREYLESFLRDYREYFEKIKRDCKERVKNFQGYLDFEQNIRKFCI